MLEVDTSLRVWFGFGCDKHSRFPRTEVSQGRVVFPWIVKGNKNGPNLNVIVHNS